MFCNEKIKEVFEIVSDNRINSDIFFDYYNDMTCYMTKGYGFILKTETQFIRLAYDGVKAFLSMEDAMQEGEFAEPCVYAIGDDKFPFTEYESALFTGERILAVCVCESYYEVTFDDFRLKVVPCETADSVPHHYKKIYYSYSRVHGLERLLKDKCYCGGTGEIFEDFTGDYIVRCDKCNKSTWANMCVADAIDEWNRGELHCSLKDITIE